MLFNSAEFAVFLSLVFLLYWLVFARSVRDLSDLDAQVATNDASHLRRDSARRVSRELFGRLVRVWSAEPGR
jgi:hypothetical protein